MYKLSRFDKMSFLLVIIGAINWLFIGLFDFNLVYFISCHNEIITRIIYILVGVAAIDLLFNIIRRKKNKCTK